MTAAKVSGIVGFIIVLKLGYRACSVKCVVCVCVCVCADQVDERGACGFRKLGWEVGLGSTIIKCLICLEALFRGEHVGGDGPL